MLPIARKGSNCVGLDDPEAQGQGSSLDHSACPSMSVRNPHTITPKLTQVSRIETGVEVDYLGQMQRTHKVSRTSLISYHQGAKPGRGHTTTDSSVCDGWLHVAFVVYISSYVL